MLHVNEVPSPNPGHKTSRNAIYIPLLPQPRIVLGQFTSASTARYQSTLQAYGYQIGKGENEEAIEALGWAHPEDTLQAGRLYAHMTMTTPTPVLESNSIETTHPLGPDATLTQERNDQTVQ